MVAVALAFAVYLTFGLSTISHGNNVFWMAHLAGCVICCILGYFLYRLAPSAECRLFNHFMLIAGGLLLIGGIQKIITEGLCFEVFSQLIFFVFFVFAEIRFFKGNHDFKAAISWCKSNIPVLILIAAVIVLSVNPYMFSHKWDGMLYVKAYADGDIYSISANAFYGHLSQGAGAIVYIMKQLCGGNVFIGAMLANLVAAVAGILAFHGTIRKIVPGKSKGLYLLLTAVYALSPYVLGMSGYLSVDYFSVNLFMTVVYFTVTGQWFLQVFAGFVFAFTKEPCIIIYGCLCVGGLVTDFVTNRFKVFAHIRYYGMLTVAILWGITLKILGIWSGGSSSVGVEPEYIGDKLSVLFGLNFSWLLVILIIVGTVISIIQRTKIDGFKEIWKNLVPVIFSVVGFTFFSSVLVTVNHARYADNVPVSLYLLFAVILLMITTVIKDAVSYVISTAMAVLMLLSSFITIDPVSLSRFLSLNLQDGMKVISTNGQTLTLGDAIIYNRQAMWFEGPLSQAVADGIERGAVICSSGKNRDFYYFDGMCEFVEAPEGDYSEATEYWNAKAERRECMKTPDNSELDVFAVSGVEGIGKLMASRGEDVYLYLYTDEIGEEIASDIAESYSNIEEKDYRYRGWTVHGIYIFKEADND